MEGFLNQHINIIKNVHEQPTVWQYLVSRCPFGSETQCCLIVIIKWNGLTFNSICSEGQQSGLLVCLNKLWTTNWQTHNVNLINDIFDCVLSKYFSRASMINNGSTNKLLTFWERGEDGNNPRCPCNPCVWSPTLKLVRGQSELKTQKSSVSECFFSLPTVNPSM